MTTELTYLALAVAWNTIMWVPYILNTIAVRGLPGAVGYPDDPAPLSPWAQRLKAAHYNSVENLVLFAAVVLVAHVAGLSNDATATCAMVYFYARIAYTVVYTMAVPWLRTLTFFVSWLAILCILAQILL